jgi:hypothetical protein
MADLTVKPWDEFTFETNPQDLISPNFKFYELTRSETADRNNIVNSFEEIPHLRAAVYLCRNILQPVRNEFGRFSPNSVYRSQDTERLLKKKRRPWISKSQHSIGQACDIEIPGMPTIELADWVVKNLEYDQVICECYNPSKGVNSGWVHVSVIPPGMGINRHTLLSYIMDEGSGSYVYVNGLKKSIA